MRRARLRCGGGWLDLAEPLVMGVLNVTPDSFSDGGRHADPRAGGNAGCDDGTVTEVEKAATGRDLS